MCLTNGKDRSKCLIVLLLPVFLMCGCIKHEVLSPVPSITGIRFVDSGQNATMYVEFTDGDGNFGLEQSDSLGIFSECINAYNLYAEYYELQNGNWVHIKIDPCDDPVPDPDVPYYYKIPWAKPTGQNQIQDGVIEIALTSWKIESDFDTVKFIVRIVDRDIQSSNAFEIGPLVK